MIPRTAGKRERAVQLFDRDVGADVGHERDRPQPLGIVRRVLREPVVVGTDAREVEVGIAHVPHDLVPDARRGIQDLGVDAVLVLLHDPRLRGRIPGAHLFPADPRRALLGGQPRAAVGAEVDLVERALHHPRVAALEVLDPRHPVAVLRRNTVAPQVGGLVDVRVRRDQLVLTRHVGSLLVAQIRSMTGVMSLTAPPSSRGGTSRPHICCDASRR